MSLNTLCINSHTCKGTYGETSWKALKGTLSAFLLLGLFFLAASLSSCSSAPNLDQESPSLYFKVAETARFQRENLKAIEAYKLIQLRFADNLMLVLEAEFSIAQTYFSWNGHDKEAKEHYNNVVSFYQRPEIGTDIFPLSYRNLALKNLKTIGQRQNFRLLPPRTRGVATVYGDEPSPQKAPVTRVETKNK